LEEGGRIHCGYKGEKEGFKLDNPVKKLPSLYAIDRDAKKNCT